MSTILITILIIGGLLAVLLVIGAVASIIESTRENTGLRRIESFAEVESFACARCGETFGRPLAWRGGCDRCGTRGDFRTRENIKNIRFWDEIPPEKLLRYRRSSLPRSMQHLWDEANDGWKRST